MKSGYTTSRDNPPPAKPTALPVAAGGIPASLKAIPQWVLWRWQLRADKKTGKPKWTKPPYQPDGALASSTDPKTWVSFNEALAAYQKSGFYGVGIVLTVNLGIVGVDLDHCINAETGAIEPSARSIVGRLDSYTEISPSGTGLRVFLLGKLPPKGRKRGNVEMYNSGRFLTLTGHILDRQSMEIMRRQEELEAVHAEVFAGRRAGQSKQPLPAPTTGTLDDEELIAKAMGAKNGRKFAALWSGDITGYHSRSEADLALCSLLSFWTGPDPVRIDRLFRQLGLYPGKWMDS